MRLPYRLSRCQARPAVRTTTVGRRAFRPAVPQPTAGHVRNDPLHPDRQNPHSAYRSSRLRILGRTRAYDSPRCFFRSAESMHEVMRRCVWASVSQGETVKSERSTSSRDCPSETKGLILRILPFASSICTSFRTGPPLPSINHPTRMMTRCPVLPAGKKGIPVSMRFLRKLKVFDIPHPNLWPFQGIFRNLEPRFRGNRRGFYEIDKKLQTLYAEFRAFSGIANRGEELLHHERNTRGAGSSHWHGDLSVGSG